ncbi:MAG TPA: site-specific integrase [Thiohalobacter sp.]|nr:site-specific integrase [Thiohalobacter sp.]
MSETFETLEDAQKWRADTLARLRAEGGDTIARERQQRQAAASLTLSDICQAYRENVSPGHKGGQQEADRLTRWEREHPLRDRALISLTSTDIAGWRDERLAAGKAPDTVIYELALLHRVLEYARRERGVLLVGGNPVSDVRRPRRGPGRDRRINWGECARLVRAARVPDRDFDPKASRNRWLWPLILLALETGMRRSELLRLEWRDISLEQKIAHLRETKNNRVRTVPLSRHARRALGDLMVLTQAKRDAMKKKPPMGQMPVIPASQNAVKHSWQRCRQRAGLPDLRFHDLRHEATSRLFEKGFNIMEVASITGHQDLKMLKRYTHMDAQRLAERLS